MPDLPISGLPAESAPGISDPVALVSSGGVTSKSTLDELLSSFTNASLKSNPDVSDEVMLYDGALRKTTVNGVLSTFSINPAKPAIELTDVMMIYDTGVQTLFTATVDVILQGLADYSATTTVDPTTDSLFINTTSLFRATVNTILGSFTQNSISLTPNISDQVMIYDSDVKRATISGALNAFTQNPMKSGLAGNEEIMIYDPIAGSLLKTTVDDITGAIISPTQHIYNTVETNSQDGNYRTRSVGGTGAFDFNIAFPTDMITLDHVYLIGSSDGANNPAASIDITVSFGSADNEESKIFSSNNGVVVVSLTDGDFVKVDVTSIFNGGAPRAPQAGDIGGCMVDHQSIGGSIDYYFVEVVYEGTSGSGSTIIVIDDLTSFSTTDALSANQGRILNNTKQDISTLKTDIELISFDSLTVTMAPAAGNEVANKDYVDAQTGGLSQTQVMTHFYPLPNPTNIVSSPFTGGEAIGGGVGVFINGTFDQNITTSMGVYVISAELYFIALSGSSTGTANCSYTFSQGTDGTNATTNIVSNTKQFGVSANPIIRTVTVTDVFQTNPAIQNAAWALSFTSDDSGFDLGVIGLQLQYFRIMAPA